jgi:hypothetical protein
MANDIPDYSALRGLYPRQSAMKFSQWVGAVADALQAHEGEYEAVALAVRTTTAELEAVIQLSGLSENALCALDSDPPPATTWFQLASLPETELPEALRLLREAPKHKTPSLVIRDLTSHALNDQTHEDVAHLSSEVFAHFANKAKHYNLLNDKGRKALAGFASYRKKNGALTPRQAIYAEGLLRKLIEGGAIKLPSPDNDKALCEQVLKVLKK